MIIHLKTLSSLTHNDMAATALINYNFNLLKDSVEKSLSRYNNAPNFMDTELDMNMHRIINIADPVDDYDLANKHYVDTEVAGAKSYALGLVQEEARIRAAADNNEKVARQNADRDLQNAIDAEVLRAQGVEGSLSNLTTSDKSNLVGAINEVKDSIHDGITTLQVNGVTQGSLTANQYGNQTINFSGLQKSDTAVTHTASTAVGSTIQPVYVDTDGSVKATTYSLAKSVPSDALFTDTTYSDFTGANGTNAGTHGLVPAPAATDNTKFLKGDGTWGAVDALPSQSGNSGKFLTTDGSVASWASLPPGAVLTFHQWHFESTYTSRGFDSFDLSGDSRIKAGVKYRAFVDFALDPEHDDMNALGHISCFCRYIEDSRHLVVYFDEHYTPSVDCLISSRVTLIPVDETELNPWGTTNGVYNHDAEAEMFYPAGEIDEKFNNTENIHAAILWSINQSDITTGYKDIDLTASAYSSLELKDNINYATIVQLYYTDQQNNDYNLLGHISNLSSYFSSNKHLRIEFDSNYTLPYTATTLHSQVTFIPIGHSNHGGSVITPGITNGTFIKSTYKEIFYPADEIDTKLQAKQDISNLVTSVSSASTDEEYPSAKLFYDTTTDIYTNLNLDSYLDMVISGTYDDLPVNNTGSYDNDLTDIIGGTYVNS